MVLVSHLFLLGKGLRYAKNVIRYAFQHIYVESQRESFRVMKFGYVTVDDGGNYVTFHEVNVRIKIKCHVLRAERSHNNSLQRELRPPVPHIVLRLKQINFKARL